MDLADLKRYAIAAREFSVQVGPQDQPRHITLRLPTQHEVNLTASRSGLYGAQDHVAANVILQRNLLLLAMVAWSGVLVADVLPDHAQATDVLAHEPGAAELLLDANPDWEKALANALMQRLAQRNAVKDTAAKN